MTTRDATLMLRLQVSRLQVWAAKIEEAIARAERRGRLDSGDELVQLALAKPDNVTLGDLGDL